MAATAQLRCQEIFSPDPFGLRVSVGKKPADVPGVTDDADDFAQIARFAADLDNVERVEVLPFHRGVEAPKAEAMEHARAIFGQSRLNTVVGPRSHFD